MALPLDQVNWKCISMSGKDSYETCCTYRGNPNCCHTRNHGFDAHIWSCLRFAASRSDGDRGRVSGWANIRSSNSISAIVRSTSMQLHLYQTSVLSKAQLIVGKLRTPHRS